MRYLGGAQLPCRHKCTEEECKNEGYMGSRIKSSG